MLHALVHSAFLPFLHPLSSPAIRWHSSTPILHLGCTAVVNEKVAIRRGRFPQSFSAFLHDGGTPLKDVPAIQVPARPSEAIRVEKQSGGTRLVETRNVIANEFETAGDDKGLLDACRLAARHDVVFEKGRVAAIRIEHDRLRAAGDGVVVDAPVGRGRRENLEPISDFYIIRLGELEEEGVGMV